MGKAVAKFFGLVPKTPAKTKRFGGGFSGAKLSDIIGEEDALNGVTGLRHQKQLTVEPDRKIVFGHTAMSLDVVYFETYAGQKQYDEIIVCAGHEIDSFDGTLFYNGEQLTFDGSGNNLEDFGSNMNFKTRTIGVSTTTLAAGAGSIWTSTSSLTGCAFFSLRYIFKGDLFPNEISLNYMVPGKGALVYDPRLDTTRGGSGAHRVDDQSTWEYNDGVDDIGRNPALQILWYLLGWKEAAISGEITCGKGVEPDDIDFATFIAAANDYDTLGWFSDCVLSMGDTDTKNLSILKAGCGAVLTDAGGLYSIHAPIDDTGTVAVSFDESDLSGGRLSYKPSAGMKKEFNSISGLFVDPASQYRSRAYPKVTDASYETADGFKKNKTRDYQSIQDSDQAQELNRIALNQTRFQGVFRMSVNQKGLVPKHYDVVEVTNALYEFVDKKFRVKKQGLTSKGFVELELQETDTSVYAAGSVDVLPAPPAGTAYDDRSQFAVTNLTVVTKTETGSGTPPTISDGLRISWDNPGAVVAWTEIRYRRTGESIWLAAPSVLHPELEISLVPLESGTQYDHQARHQSVVGVIGAWSATVQQTTGTNRDVQAGATDGGNVVSNQFPNAQMDPALFNAHISISGNDSFETGSQTAFVSASAESIATPPAPFGDDVLLIADGASGGANFNNLFLLTDAGIVPLLAEDYVWGAYFLNTATTTQNIGFPGGAGDILIPANQITWLWKAVTTTENSSGTLRMELRTAPVTDGKVYMVGAFFARGSFDLSSPPGAFGLMDQEILFKGQRLTEDNDTLLDRSSIDDVVHDQNENARMDQGNTTLRRLPNGLLTGTARDGDSFTFSPVFAGVPIVLFGAGGLVHEDRTATPTLDDNNDWMQKFLASGLGASGFTAVLKLEEVSGTPTVRTITGDASPPTHDWEGNKGLTDEAVDDGYNFFYDITVDGVPAPAPDPNTATVSFYWNTGGGFVLAATVNHTAFQGEGDLVLTGQIKTITKDGMGLNDDFAMSAASDSGHTFTGGTDVDYKVTYDEATAGASISATPVGALDVPFIVLDNEDDGIVS